MLDLIIPLIEVLVIGTPLIRLASIGLPEQERRFLNSVLWIAFGLRLFLAMIFSMVPATRVFHADATGYEDFGIEIASSWHGEAPPIPPEEFGDVASGRYRGFVVLCASLYYVFGRYPMVVTVFTSLIGTLTIALVYRLTRSTFHLAVARRATILTAFFPSMILWSAMALKDPVMIFLLLIALSATVRLRDRFSLASALMLAASLCAMWFIRFYIVYIVLFAMAASIMVGRKKARIAVLSRQLSAAILVASLFTALGLTQHFASAFERVSLESISSYRSNMVAIANSSVAADVDVSTLPKALMFIPIGLPTLLLGPFPWQYTSLRQTVTIPEMLLWWAMVPSVVRGLRFAIRTQWDRIAPLIVFGAALCVVYTLTLGNLGLAYRQRAQIFIFLFIFAALGRYVVRCQKRGINPDVLCATKRNGHAPVSPRV